MQIERKVDFLSQFIDMLIHIYFYFKVALQNPIALFIFGIIIVGGLFVGFRQAFVHRKKKPWSEQNKRDLKIVVLLFIIITVIFYFINKI